MPSTEIKYSAAEVASILAEYTANRYGGTASARNVRFEVAAPYHSRDQRENSEGGLTRVVVDLQDMPEKRHEPSIPTAPYNMKQFEDQPADSDRPDNGRR